MANSCIYYKQANEKYKPEDNFPCPITDISVSLDYCIELCTVDKAASSEYNLENEGKVKN